jgi:hypothetical protein
VNIPHTMGKSFLREFGAHVMLSSSRKVIILMFDVSPDEELVHLILSSPLVTFICGDHHIGMKPILDSLIDRGLDRIQIRYDDTVSGSKLAWDWIATVSKVSMSSLGIILDSADGRSSKLLHAICAFDLFQHKGDEELEAVEAGLRMLYSPDTTTLSWLLKTPGKYEDLVKDGIICAKVKLCISKDLLARGKVYQLNSRCIANLRKTVPVPDDCSVFYVHGIPHLANEMAYMHTHADMVWIWSKIESSPSKKYTVSVRRGKASDLRCDLIAAALGNGNGHAAAAGMAFDSEPLFLFT